MGTTVQPTTAPSTTAPAEEAATSNFTANLDRLIAAIPDAVAEAMEKTLPGQYTPEAAADFATTMIDELIKGRRVAAARGSLTDAQSTLAPDDGYGGWMTAPVETGLRDIDDGYSARENEALPFLAAKVTVSGYRAQAYGRRTEVWLDYGRTTGSLTPAKAREVLAAMRAFADQFEAVIEIAEESAADDFEGDPEIAAADREAQDRRIRTITEAAA